MQKGPTKIDQAYVLLKVWYVYNKETRTYHQKQDKYNLSILDN